MVPGAMSEVSRPQHGERTPDKGFAAERGMMAALAATGRAALLIDSAQRIVARNGHMDSLIGADIVISRERLRASARAIDVPLQVLIREVSSTDLPVLRSFTLPCEDGRPLIVQGVSLVGLTDVAMSRARAMLVIDRPRAPAEGAVTLVARAFGLTTAERSLVQKLASGQSLTSAARSLGVSISTVRTHLKAIFAKTDSHSQSQLATLLAGVNLCAIVG